MDSLTYNIPLNLQFEYDLLSKGHKFVVGVDEVGRGPLAGPIVFGAVVLDVEKLVEVFREDGENEAPRTNVRNHFFSSGENISSNIDIEALKPPAENNDVTTLWKQINDSKLLTEKKREVLNTFILESVVEYQIIEFSAQDIDTIGLSKITQQGFHQGLTRMKSKPSHILTDGFAIKDLPVSSQTNIIKGDQRSLAIGAASIIAKVYRDKLMTEMDTLYPLYGFAKHKGYGSKQHLEALAMHGPCDIHRRSFRPIAQN